LSALRERWSIQCDPPAICGFATGCDKTQWHGCAQQSMSDAATLLVSAIAADWVAKRIATAARREELDCRSHIRGSWEAAQSRLPSEEVAQQRSSSLIHPFIHPFIRSFIDSLTHRLTNSFIR